MPAESLGIHVPSGLRHHHTRHHECIDVDDRETENPFGDRSYTKNRSLPLSTLIKMLQQKAGKEDIDVGKLRPTQFNVFGEDASPKVNSYTQQTAAS